MPDDKQIREILGTVYDYGFYAGLTVGLAVGICLALLTYLATVLI